MRRPHPPGRPDARRTPIGLALTGLLLLGTGGRPVVGDEAAPPAPAPPKADPPQAAPPKLNPVADLKAFVDRVNKAIDDGQKFLISSQLEDGTWKGLSTPTTANSYGEQALVLLALAKTGVKSDQRPMQRGMAALDTLVAKQKAAVFNNELHTHSTYSAACVAMLLDSLYAEHPTIGPDGKPTANKVKASLPASATAMLREIVGFFESKQYGRLWRYPGGAKQADEDLSASQYALMGLLTAGRLGIHAKPAAYRRALAEILDWQQADGPEVAWLIENPAFDPRLEENPDPDKARYGRFLRSGKALARGFPYQKSATVTGSMTCAGLSCLAIIKDRLSDERLKPPESLTKDEEKRIDKAIVDGFGWLTANWSVAANPGAAQSWHYYYLYGMERSCSLMGMRYVGSHDWYREGADVLLDAQNDGGDWPAVGGSQTRYAQTAFALLFLRRATSPTRFHAPAVTGGPDDEPTDGH